LPQVKIAAAVLDPLGLPRPPPFVRANTADDPLYVPEIRKVQQAIGPGGRTYVGDCKMAALATRPTWPRPAIFYLCPLSETQLSAEQRQHLLAAVWRGEASLTAGAATGSERHRCEELVAEGFVVEAVLTDGWTGRSVT